jgi:acyl-CoA synthetase (NDP forming)
MGALDLASLFVPRRVAVLGASTKPRKMGNDVTGRLAASFQGELFPIHRSATELFGRSAYRELAAVPGPLDLVIALVPAADLVDQLREMPKGKARFLLAIASGFGEVPGDGPERQNELLRLARSHGARLVGPNSVGLLNAPFGLNASLLPELPRPGTGLSCVTQSGGFGMALYMYSQNHELPVAKLLDLGNLADLGYEEVLEFLAADGETSVIGLYVEALRDPERFLAAARDAATRKPVVLTKIARTEEGQRASFAHLGIDVRAIESAGPPLIVAESGAEMLNIAKALVLQPPPRGRNVAIITGSGGIGAELADFCVELGLRVPELSPMLQERLGKLLPPYAGLRNPVDLTPIWWDYPRLYPDLIRALDAAPEIDAIVATIIDVPTGLPELMTAVAGTVRGLAKPLYVYWSSPDANLANRRAIEQGGVPCFPGTREVARVLAALAPR